ncbi:microcephalin isoform X2 [Cyclopterus lumpus]|uniref:microcephalin isoform X2 n=1 Tax=Cyclopterus lumpus TaxID=8103 RepID=UPI001487480F|nr:microcephalin isoform X2 [Cyclopterus lumpus]
MTTSNNGSVLKDVVVYVDVWSSDKTANYSQPFVQQLQEMGAQVSKTFNKQVTHVVFNNGHLATWRKAKKGDMRLVSVLWVGRCYDDGVRVDEELYPAYNDESNLMLKNKRHRCMQPKDSPERTPENDRRMRKKLDKMMKDIAPKQPLVTDVSPIIIDEENGIVYSPALKRSDYMAQRLKDMKEKRENLSPTASQMVESCSTTGSKPSLGCTPTILKFMYDQSDDDSSASVAEPAYSPDKEEGRRQIDVIDHDTPEQRHRKDSKKPWLSPCQDAPKQTSSHVKCQDFQDEEATRPKKSRMTSVRKHLNSGSLSESPSNDRRSRNSKNFHKEKSKSEIKPSSPSPNKTDKGKAKMKTAKSFTETKTHFCSEPANSSSCFSSPAKLGDGAVKLSKETASPLQNKPKQVRRSFTISSDSKSIASGSTDGADDVFEDYFSPANHHPRLKRPPLPNLPAERDIQIPFELNPVPKKRQIRRSIGSETKSKKMRILETSQQSYASSKPQNHPQKDAKESLPALETPGADLTLVVKRRRQSTLPFTSTTTSDAKKQRTTSVPPTMSTEADTMSELQKNSVNVISHTFECGGNVRTVAAGLTEGKEEYHNKKASFSFQNMVNQTKAMKTLVMTSMPTEKQNTLVQVVTALGGFSIVDRVCESTTHVVSGGHRRTLNILLGIARGCWILSFEWILWCLEQRQWIPEEPYELSDQFPAAQICRLQRHLSAGEHQQDLFQGQPAMFVSRHSQPPAESLVELIQLCGGAVCKSVRQAGICIGKYSGRRPEGSRILSEQWVLVSHI